MILALQVVSGAALTPDAACRFLGLRYGGVIASCGEDDESDSEDDSDDERPRYCTDISVTSTGSVVAYMALENGANLRCDEAVELVDGIFSSQAPSTVALPDLISILETEIIDPAYDTHFSHGLHGPEKLRKGIDRFNEELLSFAASNWVQWQDHLRHDFAGSESFSKFKDLFWELDQHAKSLPLWDSSHWLVYYPIGRLRFDMLSLLDPSTEAPWREARMFELAQVTRPVGRALHPRESVADPSAIGLPVSGHRAVELAESIDKLRSMQMRHDSDLNLLFRLWNPRKPSQSAIESMIRELMVRGVCGENFIRIISKRKLPFYRITSTLALSLTYLCHKPGSVPVSHHWLSARALFGLGLNPVPQRDINASTLTDPFFNHWLDALNFPVPLSSVARIFLTESEVLKLRCPPTRCSVSQQQTFQGLGRLIGLALRSGAPLPNFGLSKIRVAAIHHDCADEVRHAVVASGDFEVARTLFESAHFIRKGIVDTLGYGGPETVLNCTAWKAAFPTTPVVRRGISGIKRPFSWTRTD